MTDISFTSKIVPMYWQDFNKITSSFSRDNLVDYPWAISSSRIGKDVFTQRVCDCTSCLITNGDKAVLMHLIPLNKDNHIFSNVLNFLRNNIDLKDKNLQAVLVGSKNSKQSQDIWNKFVDLLDYLKIPTTFLKDGKSPTHLAYRTCTDEVLVSNLQISDAVLEKKNTLDALNDGFREVKISPFDEL